MAADTQSLAGTAVASSGTDQSLVGVLNGLNTVIGAVANWVGVITPLIQAVESAVSNAPDPIALLGEIEQTVDNILQVVQALIAETKMLSLAATITAAKDRLNTLLIEGPKGKDVNEPLFFSDVQDAAYTFADSTYWIRPYLANTTVFGQSLVADSYFPNTGQPSTVEYEGSAFVYDPQLSLPAFATAISIFTSVAEIFHTNDPQTVQPYFTDLATFLENNYQKVTQGLVMVPVPSMNLLVAMSSYQVTGRLGAADGQSIPYGFFEMPDVWHGGIGAIDIYSVFGGSAYPSPLPLLSTHLVPTTNPGSIMGVYPALGTLMTQIPFSLGYKQIPYAYPWFYVRMRIGNLARLKALYIAKGYDRIWTLIQKLRALSSGHVGTPEYGLPATPAPEVTDQNAHWRLSEVDAIFGELPVSYENWPTAYRNPDNLPLISAEEVIQRLLSVIDNSTNHPTEEPPSLAGTQPRPLSLRKTIVAAAF